MRVHDVPTSREMRKREASAKTGGLRGPCCQDYYLQVKAGPQQSSIGSVRNCVSCPLCYGVTDGTYMMTLESSVRSDFGVHVICRSIHSDQPCMHGPRVQSFWWCKHPGHLQTWTEPPIRIVEHLWMNTTMRGE
jgi:hypothetical protein